MISVEFDLSDHDKPSRLELLVRVLFFFPVYIMFTMSTGVLAIFYLANFVLVLILGKRSRKLSDLTVHTAAYLGWALSYFWCATDSRPGLVPILDTMHAGFRYNYKERAYRHELLIRLVLSPIYLVLFVLSFAIGFLILMPLSALIILLAGSRIKGLASLSAQGANACTQMWCYLFLATDERPFLSAG